jgi:hypothetical protein
MKSAETRIADGKRQISTHSPPTIRKGARVAVRGNFILVIISIFLGFLVSEFGYRLYVYSKYLNGQYSFAVVSGKKHSDSNLVFGANELYEWFQFDEKGSFVRETKFRYNNAGWRSEFDYHREKAPGEFRIAIIGDSFVASHLSNVSWTDELALHLSKDPELKSSAFASITVYNFGLDGAAFDDYRQIYCTAVKAYNPDLIVLNFIPEALSRRKDEFLDKTCNQIQIAATESRVSPDISTRKRGWVETVHGVSVHLTCSVLPLTVDNPSCVSARLFLAGRETAFDKKKMAEVKTFLAKAQLKPKLVFSNQIHLFDLLNSKVFSKVPYVISVRNYGTEDDIQRAIRVIDYIATDSRKPIFVFRAPTHIDLTDNRTGHYAEAFSRNATARYFDLRHDVIGELPDQNRNLYYNQNMHYFNLPQDGHFSDQGSQAYARATYNTIRAYLLSHQQTQ